MYINLTVSVITSIHQSCVCKINVSCVCLFLFVLKETWGIVILLSSSLSSWRSACKTLNINNKVLSDDVFDPIKDQILSESKQTVTL